MPLAVELLLFNIKSPVPVVPPAMINCLVPLELVKVVPAELTVIRPVTVNPEVVLFWVIPVTFEPTVPLIMLVAEPAPLLIIVPVLLTLPDNVRAHPAVAFRARLLLPVILPDIVTAQLPSVAIDKTPLLFNTILFGTVMVLAILMLAAFVPVVSPK